jgi:hypothetical protein
MASNALLMPIPVALVSTLVVAQAVLTGFSPDYFVEINGVRTVILAPSPWEGIASAKLEFVVITFRWRFSHEEMASLGDCFLVLLRSWVVQGCPPWS